MNFGKLKKFAKEKGWPAYRAGQLHKAVYGQCVSDWREASALPLDLRAELSDNFPILSFEVKKILVSKDGQARKALLILKDKARIETVLISPLSGHWSACLSVQAGCPLSCSFCATGKLGFKRNLTVEEITDQALFWTQQIKKANMADRLSSIVFMGMGEPFLNYSAVKLAVKELSDKDTLNIGSRHISISTAGVAPGIRTLADDMPQVNLALSLHSADPLQREEFMPITRKYGLEELADALNEYLEKTKRQVFIEYAVMPGVNDTRKHVRMLLEWLRTIEHGYLLTVNLIPCNQAGDAKAAEDEEAAQTFQGALLAAGIKACVRKSLGRDIMAACGQLAARKD